MMKLRKKLQSHYIIYRKQSQYVVLNNFLKTDVKLLQKFALYVILYQEYPIPIFGQSTDK